METGVRMLQDAGYPIDDAQHEIELIQARAFDAAARLADATADNAAVRAYLGLPGSRSGHAARSPARGAVTREAEMRGARARSEPAVGTGLWGPGDTTARAATGWWRPALGLVRGFSQAADVDGPTAAL